MVQALSDETATEAFPGAEMPDTPIRIPSELNRRSGANVGAGLRPQNLGPVVWGAPKEAPEAEWATGTGDAPESHEAAVERRRASRKAARLERQRARTEGESAARTQWELDAVARLVSRRQRIGLRVHPIQNSYHFWSLRRIGYNLLNEELRIFVWRGQRFVVEPHECDIWGWWQRMSPKQRDDVTAEKRRISTLAISIPFTNPNFVIVAKM